jgi:hypothetical protein
MAHSPQITVRLDEATYQQVGLAEDFLRAHNQVRVSRTDAVRWLLSKGFVAALESDKDFATYVTEQA